MLPGAGSTQHGTPHPSFAKSLSLLAPLPSPLRGEEAHEPIWKSYSPYPHPQNPAYSPPHHSGLTGGAAATGGRGDAVWVRRCIHKFEFRPHLASDQLRVSTGTALKAGSPEAVTSHY